MNIYGILPFGKTKARATALRALVERLEPPERNQLIMVSDFLEATVRASDSIREGKVAAVAGCLDDVTLPTEHDGFGEVEWRESWLAHLEEYKVAFFPIASDRQTESTTGATASIIRGYNRASSALTEAVRKFQSEQRRAQKVAQGGYICGRPPYGYRVRDEGFILNETQAKAIRLIFELCRAGKSLSEIIDTLKDKHSGGGIIAGKAQYWDRVKIKRILNHARLYCLGQYDGGRGQPVRSPTLAFLPPSWVDTRPNTVTRAASASSSSS